MLMVIDVAREQSVIYSSLTMRDQLIGETGRLHELGAGEEPPAKWSGAGVELARTVKGWISSGYIVLKDRGCSFPSWATASYPRFSQRRLNEATKPFRDAARQYHAAAGISTSQDAETLLVMPTGQVLSINV